MPETTDFRRAARDLVATAAGISLVVDAKVEQTGDQATADFVCAWPEGWVPNEGNRQYAAFEVHVRVVLMRDPNLDPYADDSADQLEAVHAAVLAACPAGLLSGRWHYEISSVGFDVDVNAVEFAFVGEVDNVNEV